MAGDTSDRASGNLDSLLEAMPKIAEAVKAFPEGLQSQAFEALMAELRGSGGETGSPSEEKQANRPTKNRASGRASKGTRRRTGGPTTVKDLDLHPKGKESLREFAEKKKPKSNHDRNVLNVYYLKEVAAIQTIGVNHVFTCYRDMQWREPANLANSLALTANRKRYLDTSNLEDIALTPAGRNHVEQDLPPKKKEK